MKGKFRILGHVGLALFVACALMLAAVPAAKVEATGTGVTDVYVDFPYLDTQNAVSDGGANEYLVHFKPTVALVRGADWVTVTFPDGTATMGLGAFTVGAVDAGEATFSTNYGTALGDTATWTASTNNAEVNGFRVKVRIPIDVAAGADVWLSIDSDEIQTPSNVANDYKVYVQTTKDTLRVISSDFSLDGTAIGSSNDLLTVTTNTAGVESEYIFKFRTDSAQQSIVTVRFAVGTVLPDEIARDELLFKSSGDYIVSGGPPIVDVARRTVTAQSSVLLASDADNYMKIIVAAGITNPTTAQAANYYKPMIKTNIDAQWTLIDDGSSSAIVADTATKLVFTTASDNATIVNAFTGALVLQAQDVNGNIVTADTSAVLVTATTGTGTVHQSAADDAWGTSVDLIGGTDNAFYFPTTVGTHVLTATDEETVPALASTTITIYVAPEVVLTDSVGNEIGTYGPTASWDTSVGGTYIQQAIDAAATGDTVTLGGTADDPAIYELDAEITLNKKITLTSATSRDYTTLRPTTDDTLAIEVTTHGDAVNPIIIDGFTFDRLSSTVAFNRGVRSFGYDCVTVRNNTFNYIRPDLKADDPHGSVIFIGAVGTGMGADNTSLTSATISGNTFNNCVTAATTGKSAVINIAVHSLAADSVIVTGVTISDNILNDCEGYAIVLNGAGGAATNYVTATITDNILTDPFDGICIWRNTKDVKVTGNKVTGAYQYALRAEAEGALKHVNLVIKNNTFTGTAGAHGSDAVVIIDQDGRVDTDPVTFQYNAIYDNDATYSIKVATTNILGVTQAQYNWFGSMSGPGTSVSGLAADVTTTPWLHKSLVDVVTANASYPALTVSLSVGWNTLSTPAKLMSSVDALNELVPAGVIIAYKYDSVSGWVQITDDVLLPCDAFYVKMSSAQTVLLKVDGAATHVPTKDLAAGWNLIGLASLTNMQDKSAIASVFGSYAQLVSPSMNTASWVYVTGEDISTTAPVKVGEGYWIFMTSSAILGGFVICPIAPSLN